MICIQENKLMCVPCHSQGVDGLAAPFVVVYFNEEHMALACLDAIVQRLLPGVFDTDASQVLDLPQEYLHICECICISVHGCMCVYLYTYTHATRVLRNSCKPSTYACLCVFHEGEYVCTYT
jgi:hypothetical protein